MCHELHTFFHTDVSHTRKPGLQDVVHVPDVILCDIDDHSNQSRLLSQPPYLLAQTVFISAMLRGRVYVTNIKIIIISVIQSIVIVMQQQSATRKKSLAS